MYQTLLTVLNKTQYKHVCMGTVWNYEYQSYSNVYTDNWVSPPFLELTSNPITIQ